MFIYLLQFFVPRCAALSIIVDTTAEGKGNKRKQEASFGKQTNRHSKRNLHTYTLVSGHLSSLLAPLKIKCIEELKKTNEWEKSQRQRDNNNNKKKDNT
jgi:hypothetical protein